MGIPGSAFFSEQGVSQVWISWKGWDKQLPQDMPNSLDFQVGSRLESRLVFFLLSATFLVIFALSRVFWRLDVSERGCEWGSRAERRDVVTHFS